MERDDLAAPTPDVVVADVVGEVEVSLGETAAKIDEPLAQRRNLAAGLAGDEPARLGERGVGAGADERRDPLGLIEREPPVVERPP